MGIQSTQKQLEPSFVPKAIEKRMTGFRGDRLRKLREKKGFSQSELARKADLSQSKVNRLETSPPRNAGNLFKLVRVLDTTIEYLHGETDDPLPDAIVSEARREWVAAPPQPPESSVMIPQLEIGYSMGGGSVFSDYQQTAMVPFPREWLRPMIGGKFSDLFVARGDGDSMMPTLLDGDLVIVDTAQQNIDKQDRLWCLSYGDLGMIKRVRMQPDGGALVLSDNPAVAPFTAHDGEMHAIGRVIWIGRRV